MTCTTPNHDAVYEFLMAESLPMASGHVSSMVKAYVVNYHSGVNLVGPRGTGCCHEAHDLADVEGSMTSSR